jgi:hypothetical protein
MILLFTPVCAMTAALSQVSDYTISQQVLQASVPDSTFIFGKWTTTGGTETHLTYLGQVTTRKGQILSFVNSIWYWEHSHRATSRILVFNNLNQYIGNYYMTTVSDLPSRMISGTLIFENTGEDCDPKLKTIIHLENGLPKLFFRKCKGAGGDFYSFSSE